MNYIRKMGHYFNWGFQYKMMRRRIPLSGSIILTDKCNLDCRHCIVSNLGYRVLGFQDVRRDLDTLYNTGARILVITGGEPFLWRDTAGYDLSAVVDYAKWLGFFRTVICTNGTVKLNSQADYLWVSIDGVPTDHDNLRGIGVYERVLKNIRRSEHPRIYVNYTVSSANLVDFEKASSDLLQYRRIKGILFHLFTPYVGLEDSDLTLCKEDRRTAIRKILQIKKRNPLRISNTFAGLKALLRGNWERPTWASIVINDGELTECCCRRVIRSPRVCRECGCTPAVETWVLQALSPSALIENLRFL
jgi:MoaA/NifB/PqqE/SkfB family radical SAM enzyme